MSGGYQPNQQSPYGIPDASTSYSFHNDRPTGSGVIPSAMASNAWPEVESEPPAEPSPCASKSNPTGSSTEHMKHRRTRSGCYTCRSRRVKCDEGRPVCERCRKGSRECVYPEPRSSTKPGGSSKASQARVPVQPPESSSSECEREDNDPSLTAVGTSSVAASSAKPKLGGRKNPRTKGHASRKQGANSHRRPVPSIEQTDPPGEQGRSPSTDVSGPFPVSQSGSSSSYQGGNLASEPSLTPDVLSYSHLSWDQEYYLDYHQRNLTYHHYFFKHEANSFIHQILIECALSYEPLLFAVVGFAAFQATLKKDNGKIQDFLGYYNRSVSLLRKSLAGGQAHTDATMLTILQLATIEEYLGDWVNLLGHQKAAHSMLLELYSTTTIMEKEIHRKILSWYARFDLFAGLMSGYEMVLGREWFCANENYFAEQSVRHPDDINYSFEAIIAGHRLMAMDMAQIFAKFARGNINIQDFTKENEVIASRIVNGKRSLRPWLSDSRHLVQSFDGAPERDPNDIVDPYLPGKMHEGPLWTVNFLFMDWMATDIMHKYQTALMLRQSPPPEVTGFALELCRMFEAIEYWPNSLPGSLLAAQATLGIACLFLPKDERHTMWCRRKLAVIESMGYTYPPTFRSKMAELWGIPDIRHWWLPNEEGYLPIIRNIRSFIEERTLEPGNQPRTEDLRNMKAIFSKLSVSDNKNPEPDGSNSPGEEPKRERRAAENGG